MEIRSYNASGGSNYDLKRSTVLKAGGNTLNYDHEERRMQHTNFQNNRLTYSFWELTNGMSRQNQISMAASVMVNQLVENGLTKDMQEFTQTIGRKFSADELQALKKEIKGHKLLLKRSGIEIDAVMKHVENLWPSLSQPYKAGETPKNKIPLRSPDEIFFQTAFNKPTPGVSKFL